ncbi:MAG: ATP-dependent DNA helicase RecG [Patescibacteria group bacterium]|nr:ATP-dependent DNA helicase RecG [Patescibacteria group bacterium]
MSVREVSKTYKMYAGRLEKLGIIKLEDFLLHIPFRYEDYSVISKINQLSQGETVTVQGNVVDIKNEFTRRFKKLQKAKISDGTGTIDVIWFNQPFILNTVKRGDKVSLSGKVGFFGNKLILESPDYEVVIQNRTIHTGRLVPIYPETRGISSKWLRRQVYKILNEEKQNLNEYLPERLIRDESLMDYARAIEQIHFPDSIDNANKARRRLSFDELFLLHLSTEKVKQEWDNVSSGQGFLISKYDNDIKAFLGSLPFELTNAQKRTVEEIFEDLKSKKPMNRLLEGEVGSGKTVVAAIAMYLAYLNGYQSALMAPTEILAQQHYQTIQKLLGPFGVHIQLFTSGEKPREIHDSGYKIKEKNHKPARRSYASSVAGGSSIINRKSFNIAVGTHSLIYNKVEFKNLGLVVIDEQQRFGVEQRALIREKGNNPHLLTMTATPIPRTIALTIYGNLDLSMLDEMPKGRKIVKTWLVPPEKRKGAYEWIEKEISQNKTQAFIICPFIEESESMVTVKAATKEFEKLKEVFPKLKLGILHGKLKSTEKEKVLKDFRNNRINILVATPVVEVGIDFPNATIIMIEASERFGLAQLHQLRGRVGRGDKQSYCLLFTESLNENTLRRLKSMESIYIGAELAELDLKLRGPGELQGTMQHGRDFLKIARFSDVPLIESTKAAAKIIFNELDKYPALKEKVLEVNSKKISPD